MKRYSAVHVMCRLIVLVKPLLLFMLLAVFMGVLGQLAALLIPVLGTCALLTQLQLMRAELRWVYAGILFCAVSRGIFRYVEQETNHYIAFRILAILRDRIFLTLRRLGPARLEGRDRGDILTLITRDIELLEVFYAHTISPVCIAIILSLALTLFQAQIAPGFGMLAALAYLSVGVLLPRLLSARAEREGDGFNEKFAEINSFFLESLRGIRQSIQYGDGERRLRRFRELRCSMGKNEEKLAVQEGRGNAVNGSLIYGFTLLQLLYGLHLLKEGRIGFAGLLLGFVTLFSSFGAVTAVSRLGTGLSRTIASGRRVLKLLEEEPVVREQTAGMYPDFTGAELRDLCFSYGGAPVLRQVDLEIKQGEILGIVGKSGCGKSTLLKLLMRFWDRDSGRLEISETDIREINTAWLRGMESYLTQETMLFHDSIENNIRIARPEASREEVEAAAEKASIHTFILGLPEGYATNVGELGSRLSEGEKQRIGLARAFLHASPLLLLDEPTSNIDSLNEAVILRAVREERERTVVLVSHRPSTIRIADAICEMEDGRLERRESPSPEPPDSSPAAAHNVFREEGDRLL